MFADIIIVGGGASGIAAAISAKEELPSAKVVIAEKNDRIGKKILATGNGRCNLGNRKIAAERYHGTVKDIVGTIKKAPSPDEFFSSLGILCVSDEQGRMYPRSESAATVLSALRIKLASLGVQEMCGFEVSSYVKNGKVWELTFADGQKLSCRRIIFASGGYAAPQYGTDGSVLRMLRDSGYKTEKICPAVAPLRTSPDAVKGLKGVRVKGKVTAVAEGKSEKIIASEYGEIQFTENSVSGICVFNMARYMQQYEGRLTVCLDIAPDMTESELKDYIKNIRNQRSGLELNELLTGAFCKNLAVYLVKNTLQRPMNESIATVTDSEIAKLAGAVKCLKFHITGCSPWKNAQVTAGGVHGSCVDDRMESTKENGIYFCGELLDADGDCGGFNLEWAWASGYTAGRNCAISLKGELR